MYNTASKTATKVASMTDDIIKRGTYMEDTKNTENINNKTTESVTSTVTNQHQAQQTHLQLTWLKIAKRELGSFFSSPLAYIIIAVNAILLGATFFKGLFLGYNFFLYKSCDVRILFLFQSVLLTLFVPIITMKLYAQEKSLLTIESLMALPVTESQVLAGKFLASGVVTLSILASDAIIVILVGFCGTLDVPTIIASFISLILICCTFIAIGLWASSIASNQNIALFISLPISAVLMSIYVPFSIPQSIPPVIDSFVRFISIYEHFNNITHGVLDVRDFVYFISLCAVFIILTIRRQEEYKL